MDNQSPVVESSSTALKGKRRRRNAKPSGPQTPPVTQPVAAKAPPPPKDEWAGEPPAKRLENANELLQAALARYQSLGVSLVTVNAGGQPPASWLRFVGVKFKAPGTADVSMEIDNSEKKPAPPTSQAP